MLVFVTGASGFVGREVVKELITAGHQVLGLARSKESADRLTALGAAVHRGDLEDHESLQHAVNMAEGVIHAGFIHEFTRFAEVCEIDRRAIEAMGDALQGTDKPFIITSGTAIVRPGTLITETMRAPESDAFPRRSEQAADAVASRGVRAAVLRLPPSVHGVEDTHGFIPMLIRIAREKGHAAYIDAGQNAWNAVHRLDAARLYRLALEKATTGARYHAVAEEAIPFKRIAEVIGEQLGLPVVSVPADKAADTFGWFTHFAGIDAKASSALTRSALHWEPSHSGLLEDMQNGVYKPV